MNHDINENYIVRHKEVVAKDVEMRAHRDCENFAHFSNYNCYFGFLGTCNW